MVSIISPIWLSLCNLDGKSDYIVCTWRKLPLTSGLGHGLTYQASSKTKHSYSFGSNMKWITTRTTCPTAIIARWIILASNNSSVHLISHRACHDTNYKLYCTSSLHCPRSRGEWFEASELATTTKMKLSLLSASRCHHSFIHSFILFCEAVSKDN